MAIAYEHLDNYSKALESLRLGVWFAQKFSNPEDEIYQIITHQHNIALARVNPFQK